jgi:hypothetical protein
MARGRKTIFPWALAKSTVHPEIKIATARKVTVRNCCRVVIIHVPSEGDQ